MRKYISVLMLLLLIVNLYACGKKELSQWDISLTVAEESSDNAYVITWDSTDSIISETGCFSVQNRNDFDITVHFVTKGEEELVHKIPAGGWFTQYQIEKKTPYQIGIHAEKAVGTPIEIMLYDGDNIHSEPK